VEGWNVRIGKVNLVYVIPPGVSFASRVTMHRSDRAIPSWLRQANPGNWEPVEWDELLDGKLGPWAMATHDRRVVSITHAPTPLTDDSVEAGAWTDPAFRGRGYGSAVTAEWADVLRPSGRVLFYSTGPDNLSSQRLAERLGLRLVGYQWLARNHDLEAGGDVHPSSTRRG
jgi:RimJ/RimL family protein N-acetyltransferase